MDKSNIIFLLQEVLIEADKIETKALINTLKKSIFLNLFVGYIFFLVASITKDNIWAIPAFSFFVAALLIMGCFAIFFLPVIHKLGKFLEEVKRKVTEEEEGIKVIDMRGLE